MKNVSFEALHPRGADGRFIEKFGLIKFLLDAKWVYGKVQDFSADDSGHVSVTVEGSDLSGKTNGVVHTLSPKQVYKAPKAKGFLKTSSPKAKKVGGQAGSNPGGMYELPDPEASPGTPSLPDDYKDALHPSIADDFVPEPGQQIFTVHMTQDYLDKKGNLVSIPMTRSFARNEETGTWQEINKGFGNLLTKEMGHKEYTDDQMNNWKETFTYQSANKYFKAKSGDWYSAPAAVSGDPDTNKWYVKKAKSEKHGRNEALANALYRLLGVSVPDVVYDNEDGQIYSRIVEGSQEDMGQRLASKDADWLDMVKRQFAIDAWLANWDVFGMTWDNVRTDPDGVPYRIDNGGALLYRAQGAAKGKDFGDTVPELKAFKTGKKAKVFGGITQDQELDGAQRILALRPEEIKAVVADHGLPSSLADTLIARRASVAEHYGLDLPEKIEAAAKAKVDPVDIADVTKAGRRPRTMKKVPLSAAVAVLSTGDSVEIDGKTHVYGESMPGIPAGTTAKNMQMAAWLSQHGADKQVWIEFGGDGDLNRPGHNETMTMGDMIGRRWERGDRIKLAGGATYEVDAVNSNTGIALLREPGKDKPIVWSLRHDGSTVVTVETWDKKQAGEDQFSWKALFEEFDVAGDVAPVESEKPGVVNIPENADVPESNAPAAPVEAVNEPEAPSTPQTSPEPATPVVPKTQAQKTADAVKDDIKKAKEKKTTSKAMLLGDGTEADTGAAVFSSKDNKTYLYVKKKGPYAVVTDPDSDEPDKQLLKLASTLGQPDKKPTADPDAVSEMPKSSNGIEPKVGMMATAKDGHHGVITMVSPNGKFVFITDANGTKKRKSVGTVTIDDATSVEDVTPVVDVDVVKTVDPDSGATTFTAAVDTSGLYGNFDQIAYEDPDTASWWPVSFQPADGEGMMAGVIYPDGSFGLEPYDSEGKSLIGGPDLPEGAGIPVPASGATGVTLAGFNASTQFAPIKPSVLKTMVDTKSAGWSYTVHHNGATWTAFPNPDGDGLLLYQQNLGIWEKISTDSTAMVPFRAFKTPFDSYGVSVPEGVNDMTPLLKMKPDGSFKSIKVVTNEAEVGDKVSMDGDKWFKVAHVQHSTGDLVLEDADTGQILSTNAYGWSGTTMLHEKPVPVAQNMGTVSPLFTTEHLGYQITETATGVDIYNPDTGEITTLKDGGQADAMNWIDSTLEPTSEWQEGQDFSAPEIPEETKNWALGILNDAQEKLQENPDLATNANLVPGPGALKDGDYVTVVSPSGGVFSGLLESTVDTGEGWEVWVHTPNGTAFGVLPNEWPVLLHGNLDSPDPTAMSFKQYIALGIKEGDWLYPSKDATKPPMKVMGVNSDGKLVLRPSNAMAAQGAKEIETYDINSLVDGSITLYVSKVTPSGVNPADYEDLPEAPEPVFEVVVDDALMGQVKKVWDADNLGFEKPTNTSVFYDAATNEFVWQMGNGSVARVKVSNPSEQTISDPMSPLEFAAFSTFMEPVISPDTQHVTMPGDENFVYSIEPDHYAIHFDSSIWTAPKGGLADPSQWSMLSSLSSANPEDKSIQVPGILGKDSDVSDAKILIDPDAPNVPSAPKISQAEQGADPLVLPTPPNGWDDFPVGVPWSPGYVYAKDPTWNEFYLSTDGGENWAFLFPDGAPGDWTNPTQHFSGLEVWDPNAAAAEESIEIHGHTFGPDATVLQKKGSHSYYVKESPDKDWKVVLSTGETLAISDSDFGDDAEPEGIPVWPQEPELGVDAPFDAPPADTHVLGGLSPVKVLAGHDMQTEKVAITGLPPDVSEGHYWLKASHPGNGGSTMVYHVSPYGVETYSVAKDDDGADYLKFYSQGPLSGSLDEQIQTLTDLMKPYVFTDITPGNFSEVPEGENAPTWESLVDVKINPNNVGYGNLLWKDPEQLKADPPNGWNESQFAEAMTYAQTYVGPGAKTVMMKISFLSGHEQYGIYVISDSGTILPVGQQSIDAIPSMKTETLANSYDPIEALMDAMESNWQGTGNLDDFDLWDITPGQSPKDWIFGYAPGQGETPGAQWKVPLSPEWDVFTVKSSVPGGPNHGTKVYRDKDGAWWHVDASGTISKISDDDEGASKWITGKGWKLAQWKKPTDPPGTADVKPVNVPDVAPNVASKPMTYITPTHKKKLPISTGDEVFVSSGLGGTGGGNVYFMKTTDGKILATGEVLAETPDDWIEVYSIPSDATPVDLSKGGVVVETIPAPQVHPSMKTAPDGAPGPSIFSGTPIDSSTLAADDLQAGDWFGYTTADGVAAWGHKQPDGLIKTWFPKSDGGWETFPGTEMDFNPSVWPQIYMAKDPKVGKAPTPPKSPDAPSAPEPVIPGPVKPSAEDITAWGGSLTKDGYIPTSGMKVKGKGPMKGTVLSVSKDKTKAVVMTDDGKKTTRLISAISVDHAAIAKKDYGTVTLGDPPPGQYLSVPSIEEGIDLLVNQPNGPQLGQMVGIMVGGTQDSTIHLRVAEGPDGPVIRVYTRLERSQAKTLEGLLTATKKPEPGAWIENSKPSDKVVVGDELAMRMSSSGNKWKPDPNGEEPTHIVTAVTPGANGVSQVTLKNKTTGEVVTSNFHSGPGKNVNYFAWDPNKIPTAKPGTVVTAPGWSKKDGRRVSGISTDGKWNPNVEGLLNSNYGSSGARTYVFTGADGSVIEATVPTTPSIRSTDGFTAITVPASGGGAETAKRINAAMQNLGLTGGPPNQAELKSKVAQHLRQYVQFDTSTLGKQVSAKDTDAVAEAAFKEFGKIVDIPDIGWHDVMIGQDGGGTSQFYWSDRVIAAIEKKQKNRVMVKSNKKYKAETLVSYLMRGVIPGAVRVTEGSSNTTSASSDDMNQATHGGFFSMIRQDKFPKGNPFWSEGSSTIYVNPMAALIRIGDVRANENDVFGSPKPGGYGICPAPCGASAKKLIDGTKHQKSSGGWTGLMDVMPAGGVAPEDIVFIGVDNKVERDKAIKILKNSGIHEWGGRPVEEIIRLRSEIVTLKPSEVTPGVKRPDNAISILEVPDVVGAAPSGAEGVAA